MSVPNGKTRLILWLAGCLFTLMFGVMTVMGNGVINNDIRNTEDHKEIRQEYRIDDQKIVKKIDKVLDLVIDIRLEQRELITVVKGIVN